MNSQDKDHSHERAKGPVLPPTEAAKLRELAQQVKDNVEAKIDGEDGAQERLLASLEALRLFEEQPMMTVFRLIFGSIQTACAIIAIETGILKAVVDKGGPMTATEISERTAAEELLAVRVMRVLTTMGVGEEVDLYTYKPNERAIVMASPRAKSGLYIAMYAHFPPFSRIVEYIRTNNGFQMFPDRPAQKDLVQFATGKTALELYNSDPELKSHFENFVGGRRPASAAHWFDSFPAWEKLVEGATIGNKDAVVVDIGGMHGLDLARFKLKYPDLPGRLVVQDLPNTLAHIKKDDLPDGVEAMEYDFFTLQPIKGARAYFIRSVLHNWTQQDCRKILANIAAAMNEQSILLIEEYVMPERNAPFHAAISDAHMMLKFAGMERTRKQWEELLQGAGIGLVKVWPPAPGAGNSSVIEGRLMDKRT